MGCNYTCLYCGHKGRSSKTGQLDHMIPRACDGDDDKPNRAWACVSCNREKGVMGPISFAVCLLENQKYWKVWGPMGERNLGRFARDPWAELEKRLCNIYPKKNEDNKIEGDDKYRYVRKWYEDNAHSLLKFKASLLKER